jgi:excisionase family DNA binding protein
MSPIETRARIVHLADLLVEDSERMKLLTLPEAAQRLGDVSVRTIRRLMARGELDWCRIGRRSVRVSEDSINAYIATRLHTRHTTDAEPVAWKGTSPCHINARIHPSGTRPIQTQAARELDALLKQ